ncbi:MAG: DUF3365 domain-containing protein [Hylemonella sp.]|nr:DUF3365 domain-containing protein [Hylemonella sp.]MDH5708232.1 DUF3365 domain-containing protein [Hylemonella sp.]
MKKHLLLSILTVLTVTPLMANDEDRLRDARATAAAVPPKLLAVLSAQIAEGGHASAIAVCQEKAPQMAKAASEKSGWSIRRVSLRNRNPKAVPDTWERAALQEFDRRAAAGESPAKLEQWAVVETDGRKEFRYIKALPVQALCLNCHGTSDKIPADVATQLQSRYPADQGTGYTVGQIRGAITMRKPQ